jgi:type II secretory pathway pseudopilin PulG
MVNGRSLLKRPVGLGFTLVELMVVMMCFSLIAAVLFRLLKSGVDASVKGILRVDTILEARTILQQLHQDIKTACVPTSAADPMSEAKLDAENLIRVTGEHPHVSWTFYGFPLPGSIEDCLGDVGAPAATDPVKCRISKIVYSLAPNSDGTPGGTPGGKRFHSLTRTEFFHPDHPMAAKFPDGLKKTLSQQVNFLRISPKFLSSMKSLGEMEGKLLNRRPYFWITLQLVETLPAPQGGQLPNDGSWVTPGPNVVIADFFDTVYCEFTNSLISRFPANRNTYVELDSAGGF